MLVTSTPRRRRRAALAHACIACHRPWALRVVHSPGSGAHVLVCRFCGWRRAPLGAGSSATPTPAAPPVTSAPVDHTLLLHDTETELQRHLADFVEQGLRAGEGCLLIATPEHRAALRQQLGLSLLVPAVRRGAFVELDAADTLGLFLRDGRPDPELFDRTVGAFVRDQVVAGRRLRGFGEMVALLWADGRPAAALELEALWNRLQREVGFSLLCAYPAELVAGAEAEVCRQHSALA